MSSFGKIIGYIKDIPCYSSKEYASSRTKYSYVLVNETKMFCGIKWQCVELVRRFLILTKNITFTDVPSAHHMFETLPTFYNISSNQTISVRKRKTWKNLRCGDIIFWCKTLKSPYGHVAIIQSCCGENKYKICEQNWNDKFTDSTYSRIINLLTETNLMGWIRL